MKSTQIAEFVFLLAVFTLVAGCRISPPQAQHLFPFHKGVREVSSMLVPSSITDVTKVCDDKLIVEDSQNYIRTNNFVIWAVEQLAFYEDGTGWHAMAITVNASTHKNVVHILEYDKFDVRKKVRKTSWTSITW